MKRILNFTIGFLIIFGILFFCKFLINFTKIPFPAPILGIIVLFVLLSLKIIKEEWINDFCKFILKYMILFFIPAFVGVIEYFDIISKNLYPILATIFITTILIMIITALFTENVVKYKRLYNLRKRAQK